MLIPGEDEILADCRRRPMRCKRPRWFSVGFRHTMRDNPRSPEDNGVAHGLDTGLRSARFAVAISAACGRTGRAALGIARQRPRLGAYGRACWIAVRVDHRGARLRAPDG